MCTFHKTGSGFLLSLGLFALLCAAEAALAQSTTVICLDPIARECQTASKPGPTKLPINVRVLTSDTTPADNVAITFTASECCIEPTSVRTDASGVASVVWSGTVSEEPDTALRVYVWGETGGQSIQDTVIVTVRRDTVTYQLHGMDERYIWFRDDYIPDPIMFRISKRNQQGGSVPIVERECDRIQVMFTPHLGGSAGPSPANARWNDDDGTCTVGAQWKLANSVGTQYLYANVVGTQGPQRVDQNAEAISRHPPRFMAGFGVLLDKDEGQDRVRGVFGIDFPIFWEPTCRFGLCEKLRLALGSSFENPADDYYAGISLIPLRWGPSGEGLPIQLSANYAIRDGWFGGLSIDAGSLLSVAIERLLAN